MRLLMSNYEFPPVGGGAGQANLNLLREFAGRDDITIDLVTSAPQRGLVVEQFAPNITIHKVGVKKKNLHFWRRTEVLEWLIKAGSHYRRLVRRGRYDLAHGFFAFPTGWLCYRHASEMPYIISLRGSDVPGHNSRLGVDYTLLAPLFRRIWKSASVLVANSKGLAAAAAEFMGQLPVDVICNGVDAERFYPDPEKKLASPFGLLTVSRLSATKHIDLLIRSVGLLNEQGFDVQLSIAGDGALMYSLNNLARRLRLTDRVNFVGRVEPEDIGQLYRNSHIFVMSSTREGMSNAMLEAMASGLPIVTTRCQGVEELITDNGIVLEDSTPESIARAVRRLLDDRRMYERMCVAARKRAEIFSWRHVADEYRKCYRRVLHDR
ncbi:MAG: hypothetical protein DRP66_04965 [Planctomycetota bacterium]|nr:MAG: hypothetical protein DRP66_04965 [Planctomycetota bacterium]